MCSLSWRTQHFYHLCTMAVDVVTFVVGCNIHCSPYCSVLYLSMALHLAHLYPVYSTSLFSILSSIAIYNSTTNAITSIQRNLTSGHQLWLFSTLLAAMLCTGLSLDGGMPVTASGINKLSPLDGGSTLISPAMT